MELSQLYSNTFHKVIKYKQSLPIDSSTTVKSNISERKVKNKYGKTEVRKICQKQKKLSDYEISQIIQGYERGLSIYELAEQFNCHRKTISDTLKRNGVEVSHQASKKPELVKKIIDLYAEYKTPREIGTIVGIDCNTVRKVLKENEVYIRKSWEYPKK